MAEYEFFIIHHPHILFPSRIAPWHANITHILCSVILCLRMDLNRKMTNFILDVDGVLASGNFYYSADGKVMKVFGPDDNDALSLLKNYIDISFVTGDRKVSHK